MNWKEKTKQVLDKIISKVGIEDKEKLKNFIDSSCPFEENDLFAIKFWREERRKLLNPNFCKKIKIEKTDKKIKDFYDRKTEF